MPILIKQGSVSIPRNLVFVIFVEALQLVFITKVTLLFRPFLNVPGVLYQVLLSAPDKGIFFAGIFCDNSHLDDSGQNNIDAFM